MNKSLSCLVLLGAAQACAAAEFIQNDARHASYVRRIPPARAEPAFASAEHREIVRLLARRATPPVTPADAIPAEQIAEAVFRAKPINRPPDFGAADFLALWQGARLQDSVGAGEISLAPDCGFLVLKDGQVLPIDLYGTNTLRFAGFLFRQP